MNERIRELAKENGFIHEYMTIGEQNDALQKYEKFAELIVKECIQAVYDDGQDAEYYQNRIKQHFGIEE